MKYRVVQFYNGKYALERMTQFLWWSWGSGFYRDLRSNGFHWGEGRYFSDCLTTDKESLLDYVDFLEQNKSGKKVITRSPLEKML